VNSAKPTSATAIATGALARKNSPTEASMPPAHNAMTIRRAIPSISTPPSNVPTTGPKVANPI